MATTTELLNAAFAAYREKDGTITAPTGFTRVQGAEFTVDNPTTGLFATAFRNTATGEYIVSFCGTEDSTDWANNSNRGWPQFEQDLAKIRSLLDSAANLSVGRKIFLTGHSLGGALAQFAAYDYTRRNMATAGDKIALATMNALGGAWGLVANAMKLYGANYDSSLLDTAKVSAAHYYRFDDLVCQLGAGHVGGQTIRLGTEGVDAYQSVLDAHGKAALSAGLTSMTNLAVLPKYLDVTEAAQAVAGAVATGLLNLSWSNPLPGIASIIFGVRPLVARFGGDEATLQAAYRGTTTVLREALNHSAKAGLAAAGGKISDASLATFFEGFNAFLNAAQAALDAKALSGAIPVIGDSLRSAFDAGEAGLRQLVALRDALAGIRQNAQDLLSQNNYREGDLFVDLNLALASKGIASNGVSVSVQNGDLRVNLNLASSKTFSTSIDSDLGLGSLLKFQTDGKLSVDAGVGLNLGFGVDANGFYVDTNGPGAGELSMSLGGALNGASATAKVGLLEFSAADATKDGADALGTYALDLVDNDGKLRYSEILDGNYSFVSKLSGNVGLNLALSGKAVGVLPSLSTNLKVAWDLANAAAPSVQFSDISLDLTSFFNGFAKGLLDKVKLVTDKIKPVTDILTRRIDLLASLGAPSTLLDLAERVGVIDATDRKSIETVASMVNLVSSVPLNATGKIDLGSFALKDASGLLNGNAALSDAAVNLLRQASSAASQQASVGNFITSSAQFSGGGLQIPLLTNPETAFGLLLGKNVDLFSFDLPRLDFNLRYSQSFPVAWPFVLSIGGSVGAYAQLGFGYDTKGLVEYGKTGLASDLLGGLYVKDRDGSGRDVNEVGLTAALEVGGGVDVFVASAKVGGGIYADIGLDLRDPDNDGKLRWSEIASQAARIFNFRGQISAGAWAEARALFWTKRWDSPRVTLLSFGNSDNDDTVIKPASASGADILVNCGSRFVFSGMETDDRSEVMQIVKLSASGTAENLRVGLNSFSKDYGVSGRILGSAGDGDDVLDVRADIVRAVVFSGDSGNDRLTSGSGNDSLSGGADNDYLRGGRGANTLSGGDGNDLFILDLGTDRVDGGAGFDAVSYGESVDPVLIDVAGGNNGGAAAGDFFAGVEQFEGTPAADTMIGGTGSDFFVGGAGNDRLNGAAGNDGFLGSAGADIMDGGEGVDAAWYDSSAEGVQVNLETGEVAGGDAAGDVLTAIENLYGSLRADTLGGTSGPNILSGLDGDDFFLPYTGADTVEGGAGRDTVAIDWRGNEFAGNAGVRAGAVATLGLDGLLVAVAATDASGGIDRVQGTGIEVLRFTGTSFNDDITGAADNDSLYGGGGNDKLDGQGGSNELYGGAGDDIFYLSSGLDKVFGGTGVDTVSFLWDGQIDIDLAANSFGGAAAGNSLVDVEAFEGSNFGDFLSGDDWSNRFFGASGNDNLAGRIGDDTLAGAEGNDTIEGGDGQDVLDGGAGNDRVSGGDGSDLMDGGSENDSLLGGAGNDTINPGTGNDTVIGGLGEDLLVVDWRSSTRGIWGSDGATGPGTFGFGDDISSFVLSGGGIERYNFTFGNFGSDIGFGGGNDTVTAGSGNDVIRAGGGDDIVAGGAGNNNLDGGAGADRLVTGAGNDTLSGGDGNDTLDAGAGNDSISGGAGLDTIDAGTGNDFVDTGWEAGAVTGDSVVGGLGIDTLRGADFSRLTTAYVLKDDGVEHAAVTLAGGTWASGFEYIESARLGSGNDLVEFKSNRNNWLDMGAGNDTINPGTGNDTVIGGLGEDLLVVDWRSSTRGIWGSDGATGPGTFGFGDDISSFVLSGGGIERYNFTFGNFGSDIGFGGGNDTVTAGSGNDVIRAGGGDDIVAGGAGNNNLDGGAGADRLVTGAGNDSISGGAGVDTIDAGAGNDLVDTGWEAGAVSGDSVLGGAGIDTLRGADFSQLTTSYVLKDDGSEHAAVTLAGGTRASGFEYIERARLGSGDDLVDLKRGRADWVDAGAGNDTVNSGSGNDTVIAGAGNDIVNAGPGNDIVDGGVGDDLLLFDQSTNIWTGTANGLGAGIEMIVSNGAVPSGYAQAWRGTNLFDYVSFSGIERFNVRGTIANDLVRLGEGNDTVSGSRGDDSLTGGGGDDSLVGGFGDDMLDGGAGSDVLLSSEGNDSISGGTGADTIDAGAGKDFVDTGWEAGAVSGDSVVGGAGIDTLRGADFSKLTTAYVLKDDGTEHAAVTLAGGTRASGFEYIESAQLGSGNDRVDFNTDRNNWLDLGAGNDTIDAGVGWDTVIGGEGDDLLIVDYSSGQWSSMLMNASGEMNFSGMASADSLVSGVSASIDFSEIEIFDVRGTGFNDMIGTGEGNDTIAGNAGDDSLFGSGGDDSIIGGSGADTMIGGAGDDIYIVENANDVVNEAPGTLGGTDLVRSSVTFTLSPNVENLVLTGTAPRGLGNALPNQLTGNNAANALVGGGANDLLDGGAGSDTLTGCANGANGGRGEIDTLTGGVGNDVFQLGFANGRFYDDGRTNNAGRADYALITDFTAGQDKLQLDGAAKDYFLVESSGVANVTGSGLFHDSNANTKLDATDELIAIIRSGNGTMLTADNTIKTAAFV